MKFEYNGRIYNPSNLEKKLKKMGITLSDIKIIEEPPKPKEELLSDTHYKVILKTPDNFYYISWIPKNENPPNPPLQNLKWNPFSKTGVRGITDEYISKCQYI